MFDITPVTTGDRDVPFELHVELHGAVLTSTDTFNDRTTRVWTHADKTVLTHTRVRDLEVAEVRRPDGSLLFATGANLFLGSRIDPKVGWVPSAGELVAWSRTADATTYLFTGRTRAEERRVAKNLWSRTLRSGSRTFACPQFVVPSPGIEVTRTARFENRRMVARKVKGQWVPVR